MNASKQHKNTGLFFQKKLSRISEKKYTLFQLFDFLEQFMIGTFFDKE